MSDALVLSGALEAYDDGEPMADFQIKRNDTYPKISSSLVDGSGTPIDLTGATVKFIMVDSDGEEVVDAAATVVTAEAGYVEYQWEAADTDTAGTFSAEWQVTFDGGEIGTFPNGRNITVEIMANLDVPPP